MKRKKVVNDSGIWKTKKGKKNLEILEQLSKPQKEELTEEAQRSDNTYEPNIARNDTNIEISAYLSISKGNEKYQSDEIDSNDDIEDFEI